MRRHTDNPVFRYAICGCLSIVLLFAQTFKLHMHIHHDGIPSFATAGHIVDVHLASSPHDTTYDTRHQDDIQHHHVAEIDISASSFMTKTDLLNPFMLLMLTVCIFLGAPQIRRIYRKDVAKTKRPPRYYLLHPPLRAPPL